jgi:hypothetical protein
MTVQRNFSVAAAVCLMGAGLSAHTLPVLADGAGAFLGGMIASRVLQNIGERTRAEDYAAYSKPQTVVVQQPSHTSAASAEERIKQLDKLAAGGYITPEEYKQKKKQILAGM